MSKHLISDVEFVECPYWEKGHKNQFSMIHWKHLKIHGKKIEDIRKEFPNHPTMTLKEYEKIKEANNKRSKETKRIYCFYNKDDDCSKQSIEVLNYHSNIWICDKCRKIGKSEVDGRRMKTANEARSKTVKEKYDVDNVANIPGMSERRTQKQRELYGGLGFEIRETRDKIIGKTKMIKCCKCGRNIKVGLTSRYTKDILCEECKKQ